LEPAYSFLDSFHPMHNLPPWFLAALILAALTPAGLRAADGTAAAAPDLKVINLWPEGVPGLKADLPPETLVNGGAAHVHSPTLTVWPAPADKANGTAVVICPGGGYTHLSMENEGAAAARWLNSLGVAAFVLKYRLGDYGQPAPLQDVLRALRLVRAQAAAFGVKPDRIGVIGFSAGGHLASCAATLYDDPDGKTGAKLDEISARPDFAILMYPVITMLAPGVHAGSRDALLGRNPSPELLAHYSTEQHVTKNTPPVFLAQAEDDHTVPVDNSVMFYLALRKAGVPAELHLYEVGGHGFGLKPNLGRASEWPARCEEWLRSHQWLPAAPNKT
jgi:acetyl esterase/lipase